MLPLFKDQRKQRVERRSLGITTRGFEIPTGPSPPSLVCLHPGCPRVRLFPVALRPPMPIVPDRLRNGQKEILTRHSITEARAKKERNDKKVQAMEGRGRD